MKILVVLAHPDGKSFNHAIADTVYDTLKSSGHDVMFHDLYAEGYDPMLSAAEMPEDAAVPPHIHYHCEQLVSADGIVVVHPNWWGQPPAILKGWIDRTFRPGLAYRFEPGDGGEGVPVGLLKARTALVFNTSNTPEDRERAVFGDPLEAVWKQCIFDLCGVFSCHRRVFSVVVTSTPEQRTGWLKEVEHAVTRNFPAGAH